MDNTKLLIILAVVILFTVISIYNGLIKRKNEVDNAFSGMDVQLKKRYDLIPNLVSTVKGYMKHEKEILTKLTELRTSTNNKKLSTAQKIDLDNKVSQEIGRISIAVENYPDLKASESFLNLQRSLNEVESQISAARRTYNAVITEYNNGISVFPQVIIAKMLRMTPKNVFTIDNKQRKNIDSDNLF